MHIPRKRLDQVLVERGLMPSRARAQSEIGDGHVLVAGEVARKPAQMVAEDDVITLSSSVHEYVSRAALKLIHALDHFGIDVRDKYCLDIGASTGGFTQVLLERHAAHVTAVDVGHSQLSPVLAHNPRLTLIEGLNSKDISFEHLINPQSQKVGIVTCDVSFISLAKALDPLLDLAMESNDLLQENAHLVLLIKPEFEVGKGKLGGGGVVRDPALHVEVCDNISSWLRAKGQWDVSDIIDSPLHGGDGNKEFLLAARLIS
ncbi:MAG: TlyA family RNA methyltransferase [Parvibaculaceae bacterium]